MKWQPTEYRLDGSNDVRVRIIADGKPRVYGKRFAFILNPADGRWWSKNKLASGELDLSACAYPSMEDAQQAAINAAPRLEGR